jgi:hypothetical protein
MKKTLVASAIAAVIAAPAYADVTISGNVIVEHLGTSGDYDMRTRNDLNLTAVEDLGNGLKATAKLNNVYDDGTQGKGDMNVTLSGDFGSLTAGFAEGFQEGVFDAFANIDAAHDVDLENSINTASTEFSRTERFIYMSPSMNGFQVGMTAADDTDSMGAHTEFMAKYSANGLTAMAGVSNAKDGNDYKDFAVEYKMGGLKLRAMHRNVDIKAAAGSTATTISVAQAAGSTGTSTDVDTSNASVVTQFTEWSTSGSNDVTTSSATDYVAGDLISTLTRTGYVAAADNDTTFFGAEYTMGNNVIAAGILDDEVNGDASIVSFKHNLSKNTSIYAVMSDSDLSARADQTIIGIAQKF